MKKCDHRGFADPNTIRFLRTFRSDISESKLYRHCFSFHSDISMESIKLRKWIKDHLPLFTLIILQLFLEAKSLQLNNQCTLFYIFSTLQGLRKIAISVVNTPIFTIKNNNVHLKITQKNPFALA